jgi:hypothetical protein
MKDDGKVIFQIGSVRKSNDSLINSMNDCIDSDDKYSNLISRDAINL